MTCKEEKQMEDFFNSAGKKEKVILVLGASYEKSHCNLY